MGLRQLSEMRRKSEFQVQKILQMRMKDGKAEYKVKWRDYSPSESTWQPSANLISCDKMLKQFHKVAGLPLPKPTFKTFLQSQFTPRNRQQYSPKSRVEEKLRNRSKSIKKVDSKRKMEIISIDEENEEEPIKAKKLRIEKGNGKINKRQKREKKESRSKRVEGDSDQFYMEEEEQSVMVDERDSIPKAKSKNQGKRVNKAKGEGITEMLINEQTSDVYFKSGDDLISRGHLIATDPISVVRFYQSRLNLLKK